MKNKASLIAGRTALVCAVSCILLSNVVNAQVRVIDRAYRPAAQPSSGQLNSIPFDPPATGQVNQAQLFAPANSMPPQAHPAYVPAQRWDVYVEDQKLSRALMRWASVERLQFFYEAPKEPVAVRASYSGSFDQAVPALMEDTAASGYPLHACRYDNALRVLHVSQPCPPKQSSAGK